MDPSTQTDITIQQKALSQIEENGMLKVKELYKDNDITLTNLVNIIKDSDTV